jgi:phage terminase large subunit-like protein
MHGFLPEGAATRHEHSDRVPYIPWAKRGWCTLTPGEVTDNGYVHDWIMRHRFENDWQVVNICYDGHNATDLAIRLNEEAGDEDWCVEISQTCAGQNLAVKGFRELLLQGKIVIEESGLAMWCLSNAVEIMNNYGDVKLNKKSQKDTQRIDPVAAIMNALALALIRRNNPTLSDRLEDQDWSM